MSPPSEYVEEAADLWPTLLSTPDAAPRTLLELGSGGGSLAFHLKERLALTLTDCSPGMLAVSRAINPECAHIEGDMRTLDLGCLFDIVLIHDAVMYLTDEMSVRAALQTAARHCRPGGALVVLPDCVRETFEPDASSGGHDHPDGRGLRYLEWTWDPDPDDRTFEVVYALVMRRADGTVAMELDHQQNGLFPRAQWLAWIQDAGFAVTTRLDPWGRDLFSGRKP